MTWNRLQQRLHNGETDSVLGDLLDHCASHPSHADGHYSLGLLLERLQQPLDARACWERCLTLAPQHEPALVALARLLIRIGQEHQLLKRLEHRAPPVNAELRTLHSLARCLHNPDHSQAAELLRQGLSQDQPITDRLVLFGWQVAAGLVLNHQRSAAQPWLEAIQHSSSQRRLVAMLLSLAQQQPSAELTQCLQRSPLASEQRVWTALGPALLRSSRREEPEASRRDAEQLLLHPDPSLLELAQQRQRDQIESWIATRQLQHPSPAMADPQRPPPRRWLLIGTQRLPQCFLYRVEQKQEQLKALGWTSRVLREEELSATDRDTTLGWADAVILCRLEVSPDLLDWIQAARDRGIPCLYDIDDLLFDPSHSPPPLEHYAGRLSPSLHRRFALDQALITNAMLCCDAVVVSTATLADRWRSLRPPSHHHQPIALMPNRAPALLQARPRPRPSQQSKRPMRLVVASGASTHLQCWREELAPALLQLMNDHPDLELLLLGEIRAPLPLLRHHSRIQHQPTTSFDRYIELLATADIGLMVLEPGLFTDAKSANRWMEFSYCGIPTIVSPTRSMRELIEPGVHGLLARGTAEWIQQIESLLNNPHQRHEIATAAEAKARERNQPAVIEAQWQSLAETVCRLKPANCAIPPGTRRESTHPSD